MKSYTHLARLQRYRIANGLGQGYSQKAIADIIGVSSSAISRERRRNSVRRRGTKSGGYRPVAAHKQALARRVGKTPRRISRADWAYIERLLWGKWSPEQISLWLAQVGRLSVSHEWIYQYIRKDKDYGGDLHQHLRRQKKRRKRYGSFDKRGSIPNRVSIERRPAVVEQRTRLGDWELDTVYGKNNTAVMLTMVDRASRFVCIDILPNRTARVVGQSLVGNLAPIKDRVLTLTSDNGSEFTNHEAVAGVLKSDFHFAHPCAPWERGTNENTNGLIRQYFPKSYDLATIKTSQLARVVQQLNNRPRKCLNMKTPNQALFGIPPSVALQG